MAIWPTIPDPTPDPATHTEILRSIKNVIEMLTGQRKGAPVNMARVYKSEMAPGAANSPVRTVDLKDCDLWINTMDSAKLNYWDARTQVWIPTT